MITPRHVLSLSASLLLAFSCLALPRPAGAAEETRARKAKNEAETASKDEPKDKASDKKDDKDQPKEPAFDKVVKGARQIKGLFNVYVKDDDEKLYLEIDP